MRYHTSEVFLAVNYCLQHFAKYCQMQLSIPGNSPKAILAIQACLYFCRTLFCSSKGSCIIHLYSGHCRLVFLRISALWQKFIPKTRQSSMRYRLTSIKQKACTIFPQPVLPWHHVIENDPSSIPEASDKPANASSLQSHLEHFPAACPRIG